MVPPRDLWSGDEGHVVILNQNNTVFCSAVVMIGVLRITLVHVRHIAPPTCTVERVVAMSATFRAKDVAQQLLTEGVEELCATGSILGKALTNVQRVPAQPWGSKIVAQLRAILVEIQALSHGFAADNERVNAAKLATRCCLAMTGDVPAEQCLAQLAVSSPLWPCPGEAMALLCALVITQASSTAAASAAASWLLVDGIGTAAATSTVVQAALRRVVLDSSVPTLVAIVTSRGNAGALDRLWLVLRYRARCGVTPTQGDVAAVLQLLRGVSKNVAIVPVAAAACRWLIGLRTATDARVTVTVEQLGVVVDTIMRHDRPLEDVLAVEAADAFAALLPFTTTRGVLQALSKVPRFLAVLVKLSRAHAAPLVALELVAAKSSLCARHVSRSGGVECALDIMRACVQLGKRDNRVAIQHRRALQAAAMVVKHCALHNIGFQGTAEVLQAVSKLVARAQRILSDAAVASQLSAVLSHLQCAHAQVQALGSATRRLPPGTRGVVAKLASPPSVDPPHVVYLALADLVRAACSHIAANPAVQLVTPAQLAPKCRRAERLPAGRELGTWHVAVYCTTPVDVPQRLWCHHYNCTVPVRLYVVAAALDGVWSLSDSDSDSDSDSHSDSDSDSDGDGRAVDDHVSHACVASEHVHDIAAQLYQHHPGLVSVMVTPNAGHVITACVAHKGVLLGLDSPLPRTILVAGVTVRVRVRAAGFGSMSGGGKTNSGTETAAGHRDPVPPAIGAGVSDATGHQGTVACYVAAAREGEGAGVDAFAVTAGHVLVKTDAQGTQTLVDRTKLRLNDQLCHAQLVQPSFAVPSSTAPALDVGIVKLPSGADVSRAARFEYGRAEATLLDGVRLTCCRTDRDNPPLAPPPRVVAQVRCCYGHRSVLFAAARSHRYCMCHMDSGDWYAPNGTGDCDVGAGAGTVVCQRCKQWGGCRRRPDQHAGGAIITNTTHSSGCVRWSRMRRGRQGRARRCVASPFVLPCVLRVAFAPSGGSLAHDETSCIQDCTSRLAVASLHGACCAFWGRAQVPRAR